MWAEHYPDRWHQELAALHATGWTHEVAHQPAGVVLRVDDPLPPNLADTVLARTTARPTKDRACHLSC